VAAVPQIGRASRIERPVAPGVDAASELYERYSAQILGYCLHQLGSREEAEDAVQTTFMNAFRGLQRGIVPELESAWLFKIAHNVCLSRRRSSWRRGRIEAPNNFEVLQEVVPGREQVSDELIRLQDVLEEMPENQRRAILLREWQGLTYREISAELGLSQAAVETLIFRARRALAQGLEQDADTWKRRLRRGADVGGALACVKALLGGGGAAAVKVAATAIAVATTAVAAATEMPRHAHHARATKPAAHATTHKTRHIRPAATMTTTATGTTLAHRTSPRLDRQSTGTRSLPKPVALPASHPDETTNAPAPAAAPPAPAPTPPASQPAPAPQDDRETQATTLPLEPTPAPENPTPADPSAQDTGNDHGKPDNPGSGNGNGNGNGGGSDKPDHGNGKGNGKDK
jgi:RNA polymerase sigma factor (sigma-70 family)